MYRKYLSLAGLLSAGSIFTYCGTSHNILHLWGNSDYRPRPGHPEDLLNFTNFTPKTIKNFKENDSPNLIKVSFGPKHEAGLDDKGFIHIWPVHIANNVSLPEIDDNIREVKQLSKMGGFTEIKFTDHILFALNSKGEVWQWRFDLSEDPEPRKIPRLHDIVKIDTGRDHFAALDKEGYIWTMGDDSYGQCGIQSHNRSSIAPFLQLRYPNPVRILNLQGKAVDVACGKDHTVAAFDDGSVMGWGRNNKQQLGLILENDDKTLRQAIFEPYPIRPIEDKDVKKVVAGDYQTFYLVETRNGEHEVYGSGLNSRGQLGLGFVTHCTSVVKVQQLSNFVVNDSNTGAFKTVKFKQLECGGEHCIALMDVGAVYTWGGNENGEQGNKKRTIQDKPRLLKPYKNKEVISVNAGRKGTAIIWKKI